MKAEINNENKAKFFALYWNQDVLSSSMYGDFGTIYSLTMKVDSHDDKWLNLKPLSKISDEDAIECGYEDARQFHLYLSKRIGCPELHDILRFKGYAVEWMNLSVEEMIEAGWIKLIES